MYTLEEITELFADCQNEVEFEFLCSWIRMCVGLGLLERNHEITRISLRRFDQLFE